MMVPPCTDDTALGVRGDPGGPQDRQRGVAGSRRTRRDGRVQGLLWKPGQRPHLPGSSLLSRAGEASYMPGSAHSRWWGGKAPKSDSRTCIHRRTQRHRCAHTTTHTRAQTRRDVGVHTHVHTQRRRHTDAHAHTPQPQTQGAPSAAKACLHQRNPGRHGSGAPPGCGSGHAPASPLCSGQIRTAGCPVSYHGLVRPTRPAWAPDLQGLAEQHCPEGKDQILPLPPGCLRQRRGWQSTSQRRLQMLSFPPRSPSGALCPPVPPVPPSLSCPSVASSLDPPAPASVLWAPPPPALSSTLLQSPA